MTSARTLPALFLGLLLWPSFALAAPGDVLFSDDFESGSLAANWTVDNSGGGDAGVSSATANSGTRSMFTRWNVVSVTSNPIDTAVPAAELSVWVRRGSDTYSEDPDANEDLVIEYLDSGGSWIILESFIGDGSPGQIMPRTYVLSGTALHAGFQVRFRQTGGNGSDWDYWHVDDVIVTETTVPAPSAGFCDDFESGLTRWTTSNGTRAGISSQTSNSPTQSLFTRHGVVTVTSQIVDMNVTAGIVSAWIRRGADSFSEDPDNNEDLVIEYLNLGNTWVALDTFSGNGGPGQTFTPNYILPPDALHSNFRLRFRQTGGNGADFDYWHVDDVCILPAKQQLYYAMDEAQWIGAVNEVQDASGEGNHGTAVGGGVTTSSTSPVVPGSPGTCRYGEFPLNNDVNIRQAVDTGLDINTIGDTGTISFWYKSNERWNGNRGDRMLLDASTTASGQKYFFLMLRDNSRLRFALEDTSDGDFILDSGNNNFAAGTWVHVAVTWDMGNDSLQIYINGSLDNSGTYSTNGSLGNLDTLYIGDNRSTYLASGATGDSANGSIDELRIYNFVQTGPQVLADMAAIHACVQLDHFAINYAAGATGSGVNCQAEAITLQAHDSNHNVFTTYTGAVTLSSNTGNGDWSTTGTAGDSNGTLTPGASDSGLAVYDFVAADTGSVILNYKNTHSETTTLDITNGVIDQTSFSAVAADGYTITFDATGFNFLADGNKNTIATQIGGKPSNLAPNNQSLELQAIRTNDETGACEAAFQGATPVEIAFECINPDTCAGNNLQISTDGGGTYTTVAGNSSGAVSSYTAVNDFDFGGAADTTAGLVIRYNDAGNIKLHARKILSPSNEQMLGSSNEFVARPFAFDINITGNPAASGPGGAVFHTAGSDFGPAKPATVRAVLWQAVDDDPLPANYDGIANGHVDDDPTNNVDLSDNPSAPNYGQEVLPNNSPATPIEKVVLTAQLKQPSPGNDPGLVGSTADGTTITSFSGGGGSTTTVSYGEVGIIEMYAALNDGDYLGIGAVETAKIAGRSGYVGRFTPHHLTVVATEACNSVFTYSGQPFTVTVTAENAATPASQTQNYDGTFVKDPVISDAGDTTNLINNTLDTSYFTTSDGVGIRNDVTYTFASKNTAPLAITNLRALDSDSISSSGYTEGQLNIRSGRLYLENAYGSELEDLRIPMLAQYYAGSDYVTNTDDVCNDGISISLLNPIDTLTVGDGSIRGETCVQDLGNPGDSGSGCAIAGPAAEQYTDTPAAGIYTLYLKAPDSAGTFDPNNPIYGNVTVRGNVPPYLEYDWDGDSVDDDPSATATFGRYRGDDRIIYWRENFQ